MKSILVFMAFFALASASDSKEAGEEKNLLTTNTGSFLTLNSTTLTTVATAIPRDTLPLDMLTPQIRLYELRQKNSRYANFSDLSIPSCAIF